MTVPSQGVTSPIGEYSAGCLKGAVKLPMDGPGFQVMHPSRLRYFGTPDLVKFIEHLGSQLHEQHVGDVMVGDLSQPRGGPAPGGHSSHQTGLDVDLWFWQPKAAEHGPLPKADRESIKSRSVLDGKSGVRPELVSRVSTLLQLTAEDPHVERIFVSPLIKRQLCANTSGERDWLGKIRPWYGHDDHFHVRLACPADATDCIHQTAVPKGDGCKELDWWFSAEAQEDRKKGQATYQSKVGKAPGMPVQCLKLLEPDQRADAKRRATAE